MCISFLIYLDIIHFFINLHAHSKYRIPPNRGYNFGDRECSEFKGFFVICDAHVHHTLVLFYVSHAR